MAKWTRLAIGAGIVGVLVAAAALPSGLLAGFVATRVAVATTDLPTALAQPSVPQASRLYAADGKTLITTFADLNRTDVALADVAPVMRQAIVAAEDTRFYEHGAVDPRSVLRALVANGRSGETQQGASTLTMQYVRNVLKTDPRATDEERAAATQDSVGRKIQEMRYAVAVEHALTKDEILARYLNIVYFGAGAYGIAAAAQTYFSTTPDKLTLPQAALLAGLVQSPDAYDPIHGDQAAAQARRGYVLDSMVKAGHVSAADADQAKRQPLRLDPGSVPNGCTAATPADSRFFCDYFVSWWQQQKAFGDTPQQRLAALRDGGYRITLSMDPEVQETATKAATEVYDYDSPRALPIAAVQPGTGRVLALAVNRHYSLDKKPGDTVDQLVAGGSSVTGYQAGSTFKLFTMLAALEAGQTLDTGFDAPSRLRTHWADGGPASCDGFYCPANDNPSWMDGYRTMWTGFGRSVNTYFVRLEEQVGAAKAVEMAQRLGIQFRAKSDAERASNDADDWGSFTLGVADTTPLDLANAYATIAADGTYCAPLPVTGITDANGKKVAAAEPTCKRVLEPDVARAAVDAARCPVGQRGAFGQCDGGTATQVSTMLGGRPVAGKTGSAEGNATESFVGFTPQAAVAGIAANPSRPADGVGAAVQQDVIAAVAHVLGRAVNGQPERGFTPPSTAVAFENGSSPAVPWPHDGYGEQARRYP
ncbi:transglycosylase domain-containing protein [Asanoa sp. WMMD1127]|uniref:transglycosylase domain-containing protein n=1 Tax=Asanoa sp. WMMD1127 TaxID=3016107 RepID=UPI002415B8E0|nr:transglycosylase domain-containing protein [Asanoa sp. WMMD1127]MDG4822875.1 transglycosylase domain-containing protein [Asanoa sp. WMMD1127]